MVAKVFTVPFALDGNKNVLPNPAPGSGAVSYDSGFGADYSRQLGIDPLAKNIAREDFNGLNYDITTALQEMQAGEGVSAFSAALAAARPGAGYARGAIIPRTDGNGYWLSTVAANADDPEVTAGKWVPVNVTGTFSQALTNVNVTPTLLNAGFPRVNLTGTLTGNVQLIVPAWDYTYRIVNGCTGNFTVTVKTAAGSGVVVANGQFANVTSSASGVAFTETTAANYVVATGTANAIVAAFSPAIPSLVDGTTVTFKPTAANTGATTLNVNGLGALPVLGSGALALQGGEIAANGIVTVKYNSTSSSWIIQEANGGAAQVVPATQSRHAVQFSQLADPVGTTQPKFDNTLKLATTAFVRATGMQYVDFPFLTGNTTFTAADCGKQFLGNGGAGTIATALPLASTCPAGATITIWQFASGSLTVSPSAADAIVSAGAISFLTLRQGDSVTLTSAGVNTWYVTGGSLQTVLAASFSSNTAAAGWKRTPDANSPTGWLLEQWGTTGIVTAGSLANVSFPIAFNAILVSHANAVGYSVNSNPGGGIGINRSTTGLTLYNWGAAIAFTMYWYVKGY